MWLIAFVCLWLRFLPRPVDVCLVDARPIAEGVFDEHDCCGTHDSEVKPEDPPQHAHLNFCRDVVHVLIFSVEEKIKLVKTLLPTLLDFAGFSCKLVSAGLMFGLVEFQTTVAPVLLLLALSGVVIAINSQIGIVLALFTCIRPFQLYGLPSITHVAGDV